MKTRYHHISFKIFASFFAAICLPGVVAMNGAAQAAAPMIQTQGTGFYRTMVGDFEVTALSDGTNTRSVELQSQLLQGDKEKIKDLLLRAYPNEQIESSVTVFLINTGTKLVLVDTGNGKMGSSTMGNAINNLRAAGYEPEKIDEIYLTHMHADHVGGLVSGTERAFPNATVYSNKIEAEYWLNENNLNAAPDNVRRTFQAAKATLTPYINAGMFKTFDGNTHLIPGIRSVSSLGHTPGHTIYFIESKGKTLILWGDIIHVAAVQFANPSVAISFDSNQSEAVKSRQQILTEAADNDWLIGGIHLSFPGFGHVRTNDDKGYIFLPVDDSNPKKN